MVEQQENGTKIPLLPLEILMTEAETKDEDAMREGEVDEYLLPSIKPNQKKHYEDLNLNSK